MTQVLPLTKIALAASTHRRAVIENLVGHRDAGEVPALMPGLPAGLTPRRTPQTFRRRRLGQPVRRRRPRRVPGVLRQPALQIRHLSLQPNDLGAQPLDNPSLLDHQGRELLVGRPIQVHITQFAAKPPTPTPPEQSPWAEL